MEDQLTAIELKMEELRRQRDDIVDELKSLTRERDAMQAQYNAQERVANMSDADKAATLQILSATPTSVVPTTQVQ